MPRPTKEITGEDFLEDQGGSSIPYRIVTDYRLESESGELVSLDNHPAESQIVFKGTLLCPREHFSYYNINTGLYGEIPKPAEGKSTSSVKVCIRGGGWSLDSSMSTRGVWISTKCAWYKLLKPSSEQSEINGRFRALFALFCNLADLCYYEDSLSMSFRLLHKRSRKAFDIELLELYPEFISRHLMSLYDWNLPLCISIRRFYNRMKKNEKGRSMCRKKRISFDYEKSSRKSFERFSREEWGDFRRDKGAVKILDLIRVDYDDEDDESDSSVEVGHCKNSSVEVQTKRPLEDQCKSAFDATTYLSSISDDDLLTKLSTSICSDESPQLERTSKDLVRAIVKRVLNLKEKHLKKIFSRNGCSEISRYGGYIFAYILHEGIAMGRLPASDIGLLEEALEKLPWHSSALRTVEERFAISKVFPSAPNWTSRVAVSNKPEDTKLGSGVHAGKRKISLSGTESAPARAKKTLKSRH